MFASISVRGGELSCDRVDDLDVRVHLLEEPDAQGLKLASSRSYDDLVRVLVLAVDLLKIPYGVSVLECAKPASFKCLLPNGAVDVLYGLQSPGVVLFVGDAFKKDGTDYHVSADLTSQANHLGVTIEADIIKQKQAETNRGFEAINFGKTHKAVYSSLTSDHPIDLTRYQVVGCYMGRAGLINSGGASGNDDFGQAARTAVINKRAGGTGLISGRKAFQRPMGEGVKLLNTIQDVYLDESITVA